jgi:pseudaminic acid synthase
VIEDLKIADATVGPSHRTFFIAEISANHNQDLGIAHATVEMAAQVGAGAIKLQTYTADTITIDSKTEPFMIKGGTVWDGEYLHDLYSKAFTPWEWHKELFDHARELGLASFSSPFDISAVDYLENLNVPAYKIASFEITDIPLIEYVASKGKPVIISTGVASLLEIEDAISACRAQNNNQIIILKCTSAYPTPINELNLRTISDLRERFNVLVGLSDHTSSHTAAMAAVSLGAVVVEKHLILDRKLGGPDSSFSLEPAEFNEMIQQVRNIETSLGSVTYELSPGASISRAHVRSLFVVESVHKGELLTNKNVRSIRPGDGMSPKYLPEILGRKFVCDVAFGEPLKWEMIE